MAPKNDIAERLRSAIAAKGMKQSWLATEAGITQATLSNILTGRTSDPSFSTVLAIARAIGEPLAALMGERSEPLLESEQDVLLRAVEILERRILRPRAMRASLLAAAAGPGLDSEADALPRHEVPAALARRGARLVLRVMGDWMAEEGIRNGDILYVKPTSDLRSAHGRIVACRLGESSLVRRLMMTGRSIRLQSGDGSYIVVSEGDPFELIGIVVAHMGEL